MNPGTESLLDPQREAIEKAVVRSRIKSVCRGRAKSIDARAIRSLVAMNTEVVQAWRQWEYAPTSAQSRKARLRFEAAIAALAAVQDCSPDDGKATGQNCAGEGTSNV